MKKSLEEIIERANKYGELEYLKYSKEKYNFGDILDVMRETENANLLSFVLKNQESYGKEKRDNSEELIRLLFERSKPGFLDSLNLYDYIHQTSRNEESINEALCITSLRQNPNGDGFYVMTSTSKEPVLLSSDELVERQQMIDTLLLNNQLHVTESNLTSLLRWAIMSESKESISIIIKQAKENNVLDGTIKASIQETLADNESGLRYHVSDVCGLVRFISEENSEFEFKKPTDITVLEVPSYQGPLMVRLLKKITKDNNKESA